MKGWLPGLVLSCLMAAPVWAQSADLVSPWVATPAGMKPASYVHQIPAGMAVHELDGSYEIVDPASGDVAASFAKGARAPRSYDGWVAYSAWTNSTGSPIINFTTTWNVPAEPTSWSGQTIFYFNGIENSSHDKILQPVLQYGSANDGGGAYWSIASWYVGSDGTALYTQPVAVKAGDSLVGVMKLVSHMNGLFNYTSEFVGVKGTTLAVNGIGELVWASETLETYSVAQCTDYPAQTVRFTDIAITTGLGSTPIPWGLSNDGTQCGFHIVDVSKDGSGADVDILGN